MRGQYIIARPHPGLRGFTDDALGYLGATLKKVDESLGTIQRIDQNVEHIKPWIPVLAIGIVLVAAGLFYNGRKRK